MSEAAPAEQQEALSERGHASGQAPAQQQQQGRQLPSSFTAAAHPSAASSREAVLGRLSALTAGMLGADVPADAPLIEVRQNLHA